jgi:Zn-dependent protease with chaperone function
MPSSTKVNGCINITLQTWGWFLVGLLVVGVVILIPLFLILSLILCFLLVAPLGLDLIIIAIMTFLLVLIIFSIRYFSTITRAFLSKKPENISQNLITLTPEEAPKLFELIYTICKKLGRTALPTICISNEVNAFYTQRAVGFFRKKHEISLGLPLLWCLSKDQIGSVIAHEYSHLSRNHTRLNRMLYFFFYSLKQLQNKLKDKQGVFGTPFILQYFLRWYEPHMHKKALQFQQATEHAADVDSNKVYSKELISSALCGLAINSSFLEEKFWPDIYAQSHLYDRCTGTPFSDLMKIHKPYDMSDASVWLYHALRLRSNPEDTHPSLWARIQYLGMNPALIKAKPFTQESAAHTLLPKMLLKTLSEKLDEQWKAQAQGVWEQYKQYWQQETFNYHALLRRKMTQKFNADDWLHLAKFQEKFKEEGSGRALAQAEELAPKSAQVLYRLGRTKMEEGNFIAAEHCLKCAMSYDDSPDLTYSCLHFLTKVSLLQRDTAKANQYRVEADQVYTLQQAFLSELDNLTEKDTLLPHDLPLYDLRCLQALLKPLLIYTSLIWVLKKSSTIASKKMVYVLVVALPESRLQTFLNLLRGRENPGIRHCKHLIESMRTKLPEPLIAHFIKIRSPVFKKIARQFDLFFKNLLRDK